MMPTARHSVEVFIDWPDAPVEVGTAYFSLRRGILSTTFEYSASYLARPDAFAQGPDLPLRDGKIHVSGLPGAMADTSPDQWGRMLITKGIEQEARDAHQTPPLVTDVDFLLGVRDETRQGALRFRRPGQSFDDGGLVPQVIELPRLLRAADLLARGSSGASGFAAIKELLNAGTGSLGGARPKASVRDGAALSIAKFPHPHDEWDIAVWEKTMADLARACGIQAPEKRLINVDGHRVLLIERFDRIAQRRLPYLSALSLVQGHDGDARDYLEVAEALSAFGSHVADDLVALWMRIAFSLLVNNTDDHLRNLGFLYRDHGWTLSPMFDVNPNPIRGIAHATSIGFESRPEKALAALLSAAPSFGLTVSEASNRWSSLVRATDHWSACAAANGASVAEIHRFTPSMDTYRD